MSEEQARDASELADDAYSASSRLLEPTREAHGSELSRKRRTTSHRVVIESASSDADDESSESGTSESESEDAAETLAKVRASTRPPIRCSNTGFAVGLFLVLALLTLGIGGFALGNALVSRADTVAASGWRTRTCFVTDTHLVYANASHVMPMASGGTLPANGSDGADTVAAATADASAYVCIWASVRPVDESGDACALPAFIARHGARDSSGACVRADDTHRLPTAYHVGERLPCLWPAADAAVVSPRECSTSVLDTNAYSRIVHAHERRFVYLTANGAEEREVVASVTHTLRSTGIAIREGGVAALILLATMLFQYHFILCCTRSTGAEGSLFGRRRKRALD